MNDEDLICSLISFVKNRETDLSQKPDHQNLEVIYTSLIRPLLDIGRYRIPKSVIDREQFVGEVFALSMYAKHHPITSWSYEPKINNGLTPDFQINDTEYVEVYSPAQNHEYKSTDYYLTRDSDGKFARRNLTTVVEDKSEKYADEKLIIVIHVIYSEFSNDLITSMRNAALSSTDHKIFLYHGSKEYKV